MKTYYDQVVATRSSNFAWLKLLALFLMLFDHASVLYLRHAGVSEFSSPLRWPGRFCIPVFAFLLTYGYYFFSRDRKLYVLRICALAAIAEPCYWLCFHQLGNALIPLAYAALFFRFLDHIEKPVAWFVIVMVFLSVASLSYATENFTILFVFFACLFFRLALRDHPLFVIGAFASIALCNWVSLGSVIALLLSFALIAQCMLVDWFRLPSFRLGKLFAYVFYPAHLLLLAGVQYFFLSGVSL